MNTTESVESRVYELVSYFSARPVHILSETTELLRDLGMDGDDAVEFLDAYAETFSVDFSGFEFRRHFSEEGEPVIRVISRKLAGNPKPEPVPITIGQLIEVAKSRRWQFGLALHSQDALEAAPRRIE